MIIRRHAHLFLRVVGYQPGAWLDFVTRHPTTFVIVFDKHRKFRRVRLLWQAEGWQLADEQAELRRFAHEQRIVAAVVQYVARLGHPTTLDSFIYHACPSLPLPRRGDLVRMIRKHHHLLCFDRDTFELSLTPQCAWSV